MTQFSNKPVTVSPRGGMGSDVYTVLVLVAAVALLAGVIFVWGRVYQLTGSFWPFQLHATPTASLTVPHDMA